MVPFILRHVKLIKSGGKDIYNVAKGVYFKYCCSSDLSIYQSILKISTFCNYINICYINIIAERFLYSH